MQSPASTPKLLTVPETAADKQRLVGGFVPYVKIGKRVFYDRADLDAAFEQAKRRSTSET